MQAVRSLFPALARSDAPAFFDNAGGSQLPGVVIDAMTSYMRESFVQTGADYAQSKAATQVVQRAHQFLKVFVNVCSDEEGALLPEPFRAGQAQTRVGLGEVIIGPSTSQLCATLAHAYSEILKPGDEIVLCDTAHESNFGPWYRLAKQGVTIKRWAIDWKLATASTRDGAGAGGEQRMHALKQLLSSKTKLVCFPQVSNILGEVVDAKAITKLAHSVGAKVVVDGVACAPHRAIDVADIGCDWYVWSTYKVFGPHAAAMFGTHAALSELTGPNHYFIPANEVPRKFELGGANHESCAGVLALEAYLRQLLAVRDGTRSAIEAREVSSHVLHAMQPPRRSTIVQAFAMMEEIEQQLQDRFLAWLAQRPRFAVVGQSAVGSRERICTIAFVDRHADTSKRMSSKQLAQALNARGQCVRFGNFYAYRLCESLGLEPSDGVVRASFAHYNTIEEVDALCAAVDEVGAGKVSGDR